MSVSRISSAIIALTVLFTASVTPAATMTFEALPSGSGPSSYVEDGITASSSFDLASHGTPLRAHLDDSGTGFARSITFEMTARFTPVSFELESSGSDYCPPDSAGPPCQSLYDNVRVTGLRDGVEVYDDAFSAGEPGVLWTYFFPPIAPIDSLTISALRPDLATLGGFCDNAPCAHFDIDTVVLVPGPITPPLLAVAAVVLGLRRWRSVSVHSGTRIARSSRSLRT